MSLELAWAAGFFDGEGCTSIRQKRWATVSIGQVDTEVLERFRDAVGGVGKIYGPIKPGKNSGRMWYQYKLDRQEQVKDVVARLYPYLSTVKRQQADRVFSAIGYEIGKP